MKKGQALIIGDQTGVGKGRQMAALIRWAVKRGEKPIFITQKADLFSDIYRDLVDVGSGDLVPFIFNSPTAKENKGEMVDANGNVVYKGLTDANMKKVMATGKLPENYDYAVLTYSQVNTGDAISQKEAEEAAKKSGTRAKKSKASKEGKPTPKATFLRAIAKDNYLFLDESHTAAGSSNTGAYLQSILKSAKAATFASATFAKRPDTMPLYAIRTAMSQAKIEPEKLISIIEKGGVTLQEIMSRELTNAGQMVRRERDMSDVKTDWKTIDDPSTVKRARENYDKTIQAFNAIIKFQNDFVKPKIDDLDQSLAIVAQSAGIKKGTDKMGVENVPFASKTYNYTKQLMLALKVDAIADEVEKEIKAGRHPVIALESTMESTIKDYSAGEVIKEPTFSASLLKGLDSVMQYTIKDEDGKETHARYAPSDLGKAGEEAYYNLQKLIRESTSDIFISPLDAIIERLHEKGYKVGELTGRNLYVERNENGEVVVKRRTDKDKKKMQRDFNSGNLDVLILNKSASTGISLHASEKFKDQRQRTMIIAQPLSDINDYMQMIGRIDRTGQVHRGYYINLGLPVPAENRFLMMLSTKLKSLNANTTTSQDSKSNEVEAPDLLNKYGSQVVVEYLRDNPEVYEKMGAPLKKGGLGSGKVQASELDEYKPQDDDARKITGYVALLSTKEQEDFYNDVVKRYNDLIQYLNDTGSNDLKINVMPLRAKTLEKRVSSEGIDPNGTNPFAKNAYVERVEMDVLRKPMKAEEVRKTIDKLNKTNVDVTTDVIRKESDAKIASENARYENAREKALDDIQKQKEKIEKSKKLSDEEKVAAINSYITDTNNTIEERHDKNLKKITDNRDQLIRRLRMFDAGKSYLVPDNLESMTFDFASPAIFCGYKAKENKITASTTLAVFATLDSRRRIEIKLSDINALQSIDKMTMDNIDAARAITLDNWDSQIPTETRKEGYILTGNILQAIADSQDEYGGYTGHLVSYTDIDGNIHDGILMPDKWNTSLQKSSGAPLSARMEQIKRYEPIVSSDGKVTLNGSQWAEMYYLTVPKTKKDGAIYYENKVLLDASRGEFYPYRGNLRADIPAENIEGVVKELTKLGVKVRESNDAVSEGANTNEGTNDLYRFIGETGARNLDAAEDATTRLDNLATARRMEQAYIDKKARIEKLRDSEPVEITGNEIEPSDDLKQYKKNALEYGKKLQGSYVNKDTGRTIQLQRGRKNGGLKEVLQHDINDVAHIKSVAAIPQIIENSIYIDSADNHDTKKNPNVSKYHYYVCGLKIGGVDYTVRMVEAEDKDGNRYYDHKLTHIEKGNLIDNNETAFVQTSPTELSSTPGTGAEERNRPTNRGEIQAAPISKSKDRVLISLLQTNERENARKIKIATGWERGADGQWRYETPDFEYYPNGDARKNDKYKETDWYNELHVLEEKLFNGETLTDGETKRFDELSARVNAIRDNDRNTERIYLDDYVEDNELFKAYPELKQTTIDFVDLPNEGYSAKYNEKENRITVNQAKSIDDKSAIAHEVQHAIQYIEGFAKGSNVDNYNSVPTSENVINDIIDATDGHILDGGGFDNTPEGIFNALNRKTTYGTILRDYSSELDDIANKYGYETIFDLVNDIDKFKSRVEMYLSEAGEVEARNVEARINMTPEQRRQSLASETEDVAREDQLFIYDNLGVNARQGTGALTDSELSNANDPAGKMLGKPSRTPAQQRAFAERERQRMADRAREVADILHLDNVEIVTDASTLQGRRAKAKGFYSRDNGKIVIVVPNHVDMADIEQTVLHEAVAHYGLRKLFGSNFDTFLYNVYNNADENVRREIVQLAAKHNWDFATATEEYLASLAENTNFEDMNASWWNKIKDLFLSMVRSIGLKGFSGKTLSDNELRYILWRSYENLKNPGRYRNVFSEAEDIAKQNELKVGNYAVREAKENVAENGVDDIESVNRRFNEELEGLTEENKDRVTLTLGRPSPILRAAGVEDRPMKLYGNKVIKKMKKHGFKLDELKDLPEAVANPIAVFKNYGKDGNRSVLTELKTEQGNFLVTLTLGEGHDVDFNIVTSVFGKGESNIIDWINRDFATYINKEKALNYLHHSALKAVTSDNQELSSAANIVRNFDNPSISEDKVEKNDVLYREVEPEERRRVYVADIYDARIKNGMYQMREAVQDSMLSLREAMTEILKAEGNKNVKIEDIAGFENAYLGENRLSSVNKAEADAFANLLFKPLLEEAANLSGSEKGGKDELVNYMMAKHGLERNKVMAERDAKNEYDNYVKEHPKGEKTLDDFIEKYRKRDYAALTALTGKEKVAEAEAEAQQMVDDYEAEHDTEELWNRTRAVSNAILDKEYGTGLMSKDTMEKLKSMFDYYIPLRGFDEKTSEDEYAYLENKNSAFFAPIKAAKGRKSKADDPFAYLQGMAENAIMQGNRNKLVKQKFLNFVLNHQSDLASVSDLWLKYNEVNDEWEPVFPDNIKDTDTAKEVERKMQEFEERMQQLAEEDPELYKHGKQTVEVPYRVVESRDLKQHQILVRRNGRNYVITINGNPRAAQAVNGLTNPDNDMSGAIGAILKAGQNINRQLSALYTTKNPDFVVSNFIRDALYANSMAWVKERPNYALRFHKNYVLANPIKMKKLFARYRKNKLKANSKTDMMFKQFMLNGGETGYASVRDIEKRKNEISKEIKKYQGKLPIKKAWGYLAERFGEFNRAVENSARFAAFVTSREMGRSIERSIYDAKEISVNFNKKGSGSKFMGATGQTKLGNAGAFISGLGRSGFVFWNAAIQGSTNFGRQVKRNPAKALTAMATMFMLGAVVASLGYGDDDDDDKNSYWNLPDYVRRSNIMFRAGDQWVSIPLPVEYRSLYGLGELMISTMSDKEHLSGEEIANQIAGQISQVMPIDFLEGEGGVKAFIPSFIKPFAEAYGYNRSWTGMPIYKDTDFNKDLPEWTKAYKSANKYLVDLSETLNEATGGDKYTKGEIDINPAKIEHVLTGYFGGIANTIDRLTKMGETAIGQREYDPNSFLIMNRIIKNGDERTEYKAINNEYFRIKKEHDTLKKRLNNYERDTDNGVFDYAEKIDFLYNSPEYRRLEIYEEYQPDIEDLIIMLDETNDADEQRDIEAQINELKKMMISDINKYARK